MQAYRLYNPLIHDHPSEIVAYGYDRSGPRPLDGGHSLFFFLHRVCLTVERLLDAFDGFRTLKLIHSLRDNGLENLPLSEALQRASFISSAEDVLGAGTPELAREVKALDEAGGRLEHAGTR